MLDECQRPEILKEVVTVFRERAREQEGWQCRNSDNLAVFCLMLDGVAMMIAIDDSDNDSNYCFNYQYLL